MRAQVIVNPNAGGGRSQPIDEAVAVLRDAGWRVSVALTTAPGDATLLAAEAAANGVDLVLAAGGDGTVNEALQPLVGAQTALSVLPVGTANLLARDMRLPLRLVDAAKAL
ncbi:MAG: acylglycerol kinase family protein, partial [Dehalococcoidia bacterium]|nr:acylglycerol kinase family protein [Dehalococcoidia bacterium]